MKRLYTLLFSLLVLSSYAQVMDIQVKDCNNMPSSIHTVLGTGKVLFVASEGLDCSICKSKAPALQNWAAQNNTRIQVWGAMTYTYSNNVPNCSAVSTWVNTYGWSDIYSFIDTNEFWFSMGTPRFTVYNPADSSIAYQGFDETLAMGMADQLAGNGSVNIAENATGRFYVTQSRESIGLYNLPKTLVDIQVTSLTGRVVRAIKYKVDGNLVTMDISGLNAGIYLVSVQNKSGFKAVRKIYVE